MLRSLRLRFLIMITPIIILICGVSAIAFNYIVNEIINELSLRFADQQVFYDRSRTLYPVLRELSLSQNLARSPALIEWALHENDPEIRRRGLAQLEISRDIFSDKSYFFAIDKSGSYYFNDADNSYAGKQFRYTLSPKSNDDAWYYQTKKKSDECQLNVNNDTELHVTKVWINCLVKHNKDIVGVVGSGIELSQFVRTVLNTHQDGVTNMFVDSDGAIQAHPDLAKIDFHTLTKTAGEKSTVFQLVDSDADRNTLRGMLAHLKEFPNETLTGHVTTHGQHALVGIAYLKEINWYNITFLFPGIWVLGGYFLPLAAMALIGIILVVSVGGYLLHSIVLVRVSHLDRSIAKIKENDYHLDLHDESADEIGRLSRSFVDLASVIQKNRETLEDQVYDRTRELIIARDEAKQAAEQIHNLAFFDPLTNLPNRRLLLDRIQHSLLSSLRCGEFGVLMMLDLDHFKNINDTKGHDAGDLLLIEASQRLLASVRGEDTVSRLGGDEFIVLIENAGTNIETAAIHGETIAEKIRAAISVPFQLESDEHAHQTTVSIGVTLFKGNDISPEILLKQADVALYQAKTAGRNAIKFFNASMQAEINSRYNLEVELRNALKNKEFCLYYQPQFNHHGAIVGAEALIRWNCPSKGLVSPNDFIQIAEETGLILEIGHWVLNTACAQLRLWANDNRTAHLTISVNVSPRQFLQKDFVEIVGNCIAGNGIQPQRLKLELTESVFLNNIDFVIEQMKHLADQGISFSLDDFGTGYSSLTYLKKLPLSQVKIDKSFIRDLMIDPNDEAIVKAVIVLGQSLGLDVIAEGVETNDQFDYLRQNGCLLYQGYLFGKPLPMENWDPLLDNAYGSSL